VSALYICAIHNLIIYQTVPITAAPPPTTPFEASTLVCLYITGSTLALLPVGAALITPDQTAPSWIRPTVGLPVAVLPCCRYALRVVLLMTTLSAG